MSTFLEQYVDTLAQLPVQVRRDFKLLRNLDEVGGARAAEVGRVGARS